MDDEDGRQSPPTSARIWARKRKPAPADSGYIQTFRPLVGNQYLFISYCFARPGNCRNRPPFLLGYKGVALRTMAALASAI